MAFILASASPRRRDLLSQMGIVHEVRVAQLAEVRMADETALAYGYRISHAKALAVASGCAADDWVLAADTEVLVGDDTLGKPQDERHFLQMIERLSDATHAVQTVLCLMRGGRVWQTHQLSLVRFRAIAPAEASAYWQTGEPCDKAGGYAIQGRAAAWVCGFQGSFSGVVGLPLYELDQMLKAAGWQA